jgi:hypothetical protein
MQHEPVALITVSLTHATGKVPIWAGIAVSL